MSGLVPRSSILEKKETWKRIPASRKSPIRSAIFGVMIIGYLDPPVSTST